MTSVLIIGGGVIGLSIAREFHKKGITSLTILDQGMIGKESSYAAAGMLAPQSEADQADDFFNICSESRDLYPKFSKELYTETGIDIELDQNGTLYLAFSESDRKEIEKRYSWQQSAGLEVERLTAGETHRLEPFISPDSTGSLFFPNDWQVENRKLLRALIEYAEINRIGLIENTKVVKLVKKSEKIDLALTEGGEEFAADIVVLASGAWTSLIKIENRMVGIPGVSPIRGQMLSFHTA
ncbi:MAG: FAD-dependent oxidoreductase, partial [Acidobacteria bacterium]|nr:FAD-dependent oxidoreductase [Acidobacteriota bacterium]